MENQVFIAEYDTRWPMMFEREKELILARIGPEVVAIEHIGSTAVPGLGAKPIIDIMVALHSLDRAALCIEPLAAINYEYVPEYEAAMPFRRYFRKGARHARSHHLHVVEHDGDFWRRHLLFRDFLRSHPAEAEQYYRLKKELAGRFSADRAAYTDAKTSFIEAAVERAARGEP